MQRAQLTSNAIPIRNKGLTMFPHPAHSERRSRLPISFWYISSGIAASIGEVGSLPNRAKVEQRESIQRLYPSTANHP